MTRNIRDRWIHLRINKDEALAVSQLQNHLQRKSRSHVLRKMIRDSIGQGPDLCKDELIIFRNGIRELAAIGNNLNQIARAMNKGLLTDPSWNVQVVKDLERQVTALKKELMEMVMRSQSRWVKYD